MRRPGAASGYPDSVSELIKRMDGTNKEIQARDHVFFWFYYPMLACPCFSHGCRARRIASPGTHLTPAEGLPIAPVSPAAPIIPTTSIRAGRPLHGNVRHPISY